jgi:hypothetical protein
MEITHRNDRGQGLRRSDYDILPFKSKPLNTNIKLTLHKALIRSVMTYACAAREFAADIHLPQRLQNKVLYTIGKFPRHTPVCELYKASIFCTFMII